MPTGLSTDKGFIGGGDLMVKNLGVAGDQYTPIGNASVFQLTPKVTEVERKSFMRDTFGQTLEIHKDTDGVELSIELNTLGRENMALALGGEDAAYTQAELTAQEITLTLPHGKWVETGYHNISAVTITDKVEGVDFLVKPQAGMIMALATGSIADGAETTMTLNAAAIAGYDIAGGKLADVIVAFKLDGLNKRTGESVITDVFRVSISASDAFNLITSDFNTLKLSGKAETPAGYTNPFRVRVLPAMA